MSARLSLGVSGAAMVVTRLLSVAALAVAVGCGGDVDVSAAGLHTQDDCSGPDCSCGVLLGEHDENGRPWPTYGDASAALADCSQRPTYTIRVSGTCSDGKAFLSWGTGYVSETFYFSADSLVGVQHWTDVGASCEDQLGDIQCERSGGPLMFCDASAPDGGTK